MGIKRLYQEGSEITKGKNTWDNRETGWVDQGERSKTEIKRSADLVRSCRRCPIDGTEKVFNPLYRYYALVQCFPK